MDQAAKGLDPVVILERPLEQQQRLTTSLEVGPRFAIDQDNLRPSRSRWTSARDRPGQHCPVRLRWIGGGKRDCDWMVARLAIVTQAIDCAGCCKLSPTEAGNEVAATHLAAFLEGS
jgi:hypothetical protein